MLFAERFARSWPVLVAGMLLVGGLVAGSGLLEEQGFLAYSADPKDSESAAASQDDYKYAYPELSHFAYFVGPWKVTEYHYNPAGEIIATRRGTEEIRWVVDRHAIQRQYNTSVGSSVFRALGMFTWDATKGHYYGVWMDNNDATSPTHLTGDWNAETLTMVFTVSSDDPSAVKHQVIEKFVDAENRTATTYRLEGSSVVKLSEIEYKRTIPCPAKIRSLYDFNG